MLCFLGYLINRVSNITASQQLNEIPFEERVLYCDGFSFSKSKEEKIQVFYSSEQIGLLNIESLPQNITQDEIRNQFCPSQFERDLGREYRDAMLFYEADFSLNQAVVYLENSVFIRAVIPQNLVLSCETNELNYARMNQFIQKVQIR